ncbi:MAG: 2OG-Fe(II) oxygenase [Archangium sp.]|nr:2OG-Fe(II) oxygenase [Archangium sp.]
MFTATEVEQLGSRGFFTKPAFLGPSLALQVRAEAQRVPMKRAGIRRGHELDDAVRTDEIAWLTAGEATGALAEAVAHFAALMQPLNEAAWLGLRSFDLQLSHYGPGAHYARHRDAFPGQDNRRVTAIVYLNEGWGPQHGGQLRLHVAPPIDLEPTLDRLVIFRSELVEHEVLESKADRWALTAWFSAR